MSASGYEELLSLLGMPSSRGVRAYAELLLHNANDLENIFDVDFHSTLRVRATWVLVLDS